MDFAQHYKIGTDWDHTRASYLQYKGRKLMSAWHISAMPQCITGITNHITDMDTASNSLVTRLVTTMTMTIPQHHMDVIPVTLSSHPLHTTDITIELMEVIENPLLYTEQPYLCV